MNNQLFQDNNNFPFNNENLFQQDNSPHDNIIQNQQNIENLNHHRRSKHEREGRDYKCEYCDKSYLSKPALNNHLYAKHQEILQKLHITKKNRGRPRKYLLSADYVKTKFQEFFNENKRKKNLDVGINDINNDLAIAFDSLYKQEFEKYVFINKDIYKNIDDHPITKKLKKEEKKNIAMDDNKNNNIDTNKKPSCDEAMIEYLNEISSQTNDKYYIFCIQFILLFREFINYHKKKSNSNNENNANENNEKENSIEYSMIDSPESLPDFCNEFYSDFLEANDFFCIKNEDDRNELIELLQHFCYWLFDKKYTNLRLSLA